MLVVGLVGPRAPPERTVPFVGSFVPRGGIKWCGTAEGVAAREVDPPGTGRGLH